MDIITSFALGDDIAVLLLALAVLAVGAVVAGFFVPQRLARHGAAVARRRADDDADGSEEFDVDDEDDLEIAAEDDPDVLAEEDSDTGDERVDATLGRRLGSVVSAGVMVAFWVGVPLAAILMLMPGGTDVRILRGGMFLVGLFAGGIAAWRASGMVVSGLAIAPSDRPRAMARFGGVFVAGALAIGVAPVIPTIWVLGASAASPLIAYAGGVVLFALALHAVVSLAHTTGEASTVLVGVDENGVDADDAANPGAAHLHVAELLRQGPARAATLAALVAVTAAVGVRVGVPAFAGEAIGVTVLVLAVAIAIALLVAAFPVVGRDGQERTALRLGTVLPSVLAVAAVAATAALWLPSAFENLRFQQVGMGDFTDPAIVGQPTGRDEFEPQILQSIDDMSQWISTTDETRDAGVFLDTLTMYGVNPGALVALALGLGGLATLGLQLTLSRVLRPQGPVALRIARTSRTGGALGAIAALGSSALTAVAALAMLAVVLVVLQIFGEGVPELTSAMLGFAGAGGLVVVAASAALHTGGVIANRPATEAATRSASRGGTLETAGGLQLTLAMLSLPVLAPIVAAIAAADRGPSVWEDRALHAMTPSALTVLGGIGLAVLALVLIAAGTLHGNRRVGIAAVVDTRTVLLDEKTHVTFDDLGLAARRQALAPVATAGLMPFVAGFGFGPAAVPVFVATLVVLAAVLAVFSSAFEGTSAQAVEEIRDGRYGGPGSWAHAGASGTSALAGMLQGALGTLISMAAAVGALLGLLTVSSTVNMMVDGTDVFLRWGVAAVALLAIGACWLYAITAPETDLEDEIDEESAPLFARREDEREDRGALLMDWDVGAHDTEEDAEPDEADGDAGADESAADEADGGSEKEPARAASARKRKGRGKKKRR